MAYTVLYASGWEAGTLGFYTQAGWTVSSGTVTIQSVAPYLHKTGLGYGGAYSVFLNEFPGAALRSPTLPAGGRWINFWYGTTPALWSALNPPLYFTLGGSSYQAAVVFNYFSQRVDFYCDGVIVASSSVGTWVPGTPYWVSVFYEADPVAGRCKVYLDGVMVLDTGVGDTSTAGVAGWDGFTFGYVGVGPNYGGWGGAIDDLSVTDDDGGTITSPPFPECYAIAQVPGSDVTTGLTPNPGAPNYGNVDDIPAQQVTYNEATAPGQEDLYGLVAMAVAPASIPIVAVWAQATRDGGITQGELHVVSGLSDTYGTVETLPATPSFGSIARYFAENPDGPAAWSQVTVDAMQIGIRFT